MTEYILSQGVVILVLFILTCFLLCTYWIKVSRPAKLREFQFRVFAIRDSVVRLVAEGEITEDDSDWQELYSIVNESAKFAMVKKYGFSYVLSFVRDVEPPSEDRIKGIESLPEPIKKKWAELAETILGICWEGSLKLRLAVRAGQAVAFIRNWQQRRWPRESTHIRQWKNVSQASGGTNRTGFSPA